MIQVTFNKKFKKKFAKLDLKIRQKFKERRNLFVLDPNDSILNLHKLHGEYADDWSINITGDHRAIFEKITNDTVVFVNIGTHSELFG